MPDEAIDYDDVTDFNKALKRFPQQVNRMVRQALRGATELLRGDIAQYPAATAANAPPGDGYRWYERGFGTRTVTGKSYPTSQLLGRSWTTKVIGQGPWQGRVGTTVSYAPVVQDKDKQAAVHRGRWRTVQDSVKDNKRRVVSLILAGIRRAIALVRG
jgi:hypothetical protein